ncbi:hypothetical protein QUB68_28330 [Microcoleus sp. A006_D1]|uniref:hypothetical protein n=1 Tax=Microcoleus sp. A006_D1 TaxID=3055267 RepID=UPI002FD14C94
MEPPNIYTFKRSQVPPLDDAIKAEMGEIDLVVSNLILSNPGHYRALSALQKMLYALAERCEIKLESILIIPDYDIADELGNLIVSLNNLPREEKSTIAFESVKAKTAIQLLARSRGWSEEEVLTEVEVVAIKRLYDLSFDEESEIVHKISQNLKNSELHPY